MSLLDMFRKSRKSTPSVSTSGVTSLGKMWACVVKIEPWNDDWYDVMVKEVDIEDACVRGGEERVISFELNPFNKGDGVRLRGPVGQLEYLSQPCQWVGFFDTREKAEDAYRKLASSLVDRIESTSRRLLQSSKS